VRAREWKLPPQEAINRMERRSNREILALRHFREQFEPPETWRCFSASPEATSRKALPARLEATLKESY